MQQVLKIINLSRTFQNGNRALGFSYTSDRNPRHAELAALFDALLQDAERRTRLEPILLAPLMERQSSTRKKTGS